VPAFAITYDFWTTLSSKSMLGVTAHFVDEDFRMHRLALAVREMEGKNPAFLALFAVSLSVLQLSTRHPTVSERSWP
jgi:hypothetical protein